MVLDKDKKAALDLQNQARREAPGARRPNLVWDDNLAHEAENWALQIAMKGALIHDHECGRGENLAWLLPGGPGSYAHAAQLWIGEKKNYHGEVLTNEPDPPEIELKKGHYTQIIWPEATRVGMGHFDAPRGDPEWPNGGTYVVARYDVCQTVGQTAWRPSEGNPFGYSDRTDHGSSAWNEEQWIRKYGVGHHL